MAKTHIPWTRELTDAFIEEAMLSDVEKEVLEARIRNKTITEIAMQTRCSSRTINRIVKRLIMMYDSVQRQNPDKFPQSYKSEQEIYMDTH